MALLPHERYSNIVNSLYAYIQTNYSTTQIDFQGLATLDTKTITEWIWVGTDVIGRRNMRQVTTDPALPRGFSWGNLVTLYLTTIISVKPNTNLLRAYEIRDILVNLLRRATITITDYAGGAGAQGRLYGCEIIEESALGVENDVTRLRVVFEYKYMENFE